MGGSDSLLWDWTEACWADSARARASMRAAFLGGGGGGRTELMGAGVGSFGESRATAPGSGQKNNTWELQLRRVSKRTLGGEQKIKDNRQAGFKVLQE